MISVKQNKNIQEKCTMFVVTHEKSVNKPENLNVNKLEIKNLD